MLDRSGPVVPDVITWELLIEGDDREFILKLATPESGKKVPEDLTVLLQLGEVTAGVEGVEAVCTIAGAMGTN